MTPKDMLTNPYFCPIPWTGMMYNFDGAVKNCVRSAGTLGNIKDQPIDQILVDNNQPRQQQIVDQQPVGTCHTCYDLERGKKGFDHISDRVFYIRELKNTPPSTYQVGRFDLQTIDVRWTNLCNFACVYCNPTFSSKWSEELKIRHNVPDQQQLTDFKNYIYDHAGQLKHVYLAGGEPLLMKENLTLLEKLNPDANIRINTNLSKVDTRVFEAVCEFPNVHWTVSVETQTEEFEYIRYGGSWTDFLDNLSTIKKLNHKISFNMLHFLLNYNSIFDCVDFLKEQGFHNNSFVIGALLGPDHLNIRHLPSNVLNSVKSKLQDRINQTPGYLLEDSYRNMLHYIDIPFEKNIKLSVDKISEMDQRRGIDSKTIFKDFYKDIDHGKTI
jgi:sulfatase maturation enzyme AslB (radical SAM superfamily)